MLKNNEKSVIICEKLGGDNYGKKQTRTDLSNTRRN